MLDWNRDRQAFCAYMEPRLRRRVTMLDHLRREAANETSRKLVDRLARDRKVATRRTKPGPTVMAQPVAPDSVGYRQSPGIQPSGWEAQELDRNMRIAEELEHYLETIHERMLYYCG